MKIREWVSRRTLLIAAVSLVFLCSGYGLFVVEATSAQQTSVDVELTVPETKVAFSGYAAPNSLVKVLKNNTPITSISADSLGYYNVSFTHQTGVYSFDVYYTDVTGVESSKTTTSVSITSQKTTQKTLHLSPTISLGSQTSVSKGSVVSVYGYTAANSRIRITRDYGKQLYETTSDTSGYYQYLLQTSDMISGEHLLSSYVLVGSDKSASSRIVRFSVEDSTAQPSLDFIVGPAVLAPPSILLPEDGAVIDSESVEIIGESAPGSQINVYQDGVLYGSFFADEQGKWKFVFIPTYSPVTLQFESCIDGECSILSRTITLVFSSLNLQCKLQPELVEYRFWGIEKGSSVELELQEGFDGTISIDWGDGTEERFSSSLFSARSFSKAYDSVGKFDGVVTFQDGDCEYERYFSVHTVAVEKEFRHYALLLILLGLIVGSYLAHRDRKAS